ncbi:MAG: alpha-L-rhamnosidase N-terminal domain-containing protein [Mucilaginibacter polytrichastri]|nr:alpha-L-rhamnosidase N-terminal domain-containing protein [Mucilaginibacter polytrichastri]
MKRFSAAFFTCLFLVCAARAQDVPVNPKWLNDSWKANWITCPGVAQKDYGVYHFRKNFPLAAKPAKFIVHVSGDNRYRLFVNGKSVSSGPSRGDLYTWFFDSVDIGPYMKAGENTLAALAWNMGDLAPVAQISNQTGFILQGDGDAEQIANTDKSWKVIRSAAYEACSTDNGPRLHSYMVIGPGDRIDGNRYDWGWEQTGFDDKKWKDAVTVSPGHPSGTGTDNMWTLAPRNIPPMEEFVQPLTKVRRASGLNSDAKFLGVKSALQIPANKTVSLLLDQEQLTKAFPELHISGGRNAEIKITYAEAMMDDQLQKGHRDSITGKSIHGNFDIFIADGGANRVFRPLWMRTYRYVQLDIKTSAQPLTIHKLDGIYSGYPFKAVAKFSSNDASLKKIWDVGWHTARMCAGETYFDCPYYEQLQYEGDTRIQSLISLYVSGDDRLMRKALLDFWQSRVPEGLTQGRYPSNRLQVIPPFSLFWVSMVHDYMMLRRDDDFLKKFLPAVRGVLAWYEDRIDAQKNMLGPMKWWSFTDWADAFGNGVPPGATDGNSSVISLQYVYTLMQAEKIFRHFGDGHTADQYKELADKVAKGTYASCFHLGKSEMGDTPEQKTFSQHAGIMAILSGAVPENEREKVLGKILGDTSMIQATFYYRFYLTRALAEAGMADRYYAELKPWREMLKIGLTTFAEKPEPTRSDCHAWSASPNYDFLSTLCGIMPASPGFRTVEIKPAMGKLTQISASMPHPDGRILVSLKKQGEKGIEAEITLPEKLSGEFVWLGKVKKLSGGKQHIRF